jgi:hypothetical protein
MIITYVLNLRMGESETVDLRYHPFGTMNHSISLRSILIKLIVSLTGLVEIIKTMLYNSYTITN